MAFEESPWYPNTCKLCKCIEGVSPCTICAYFKFRCKGTCTCCEDYRKSLPSTSRGLGPSSVPTEDAERFCDQCNCLRKGKSCRKCIRGRYKCTGTCPCCSKSREKTNITVSEKDLDNMLRSSVLTRMQNDKAVLLVPLETFNTISGASTQTTSPPQEEQIRKPPDRPASKLKAKKNRRILCNQCFCEADNIPCQICCFKDARCRGACPCCHMKSTLRFLNPDDNQMFEPICPRCTRTPGEGICDHCQEVAEESAAALERCRPKKGPLSKPAILTHKKKGKDDDTKGEGAKGNQAKDKGAKGDQAKNKGTKGDQAKNKGAKGDQAKYKGTKSDEAKDVEPPTESKEKEETKVVFVPNDLQLLDQSYVKNEYCLNCQCKRGKEPCNACKNSPCFGKCECCVEFNRQLLEYPIENLPENREPKEEEVKTRNTGAVKKRKSSSPANGRSQKVKTVHCQASTSQTHADRLYPESLKCERCNCIKYCRPCEDCSDMDMGCTFPVDGKLCLSCSFRYEF